MTAYGLVRTLQIISALLWAICLVRKTPGMFRVMRRRSLGDDGPRAALWFIAADQIGFCLRWYAFPRAIDVMSNDELGWWSGLYTLSALCAIWGSLAVPESRNDAR